MSPTPDRIQWHSDMLVTPASQRLLSRRIDGLVHALPGRYQPFFWGVSGEVEYDLDALKNRVLTVRVLDAVMRNGCHVAVDQRAGLSLPLSIDDGRSVIVRVAPGEDAEDVRRFVPCGGDDEGVVVGEDGVKIPLSRPRLVLYADRSPRPAPADASFPLCEVRREGDAYRLTDFVPPTLQVTAGSALGQRCRSIPVMLRSEASTVTDRPRLNPMVSTLPAFEVVLGGNPHPFELYIELCRVAGAVAVLRNQPMPAFPAYDHDAAGTAFEQVVRYVTGETGEKPSGTFERFTFEREDTRFRLRPDPGWTDAIRADSGSGLVLTIESDDAHVQRWGENCVIASRSVAETMLVRRLLGCARRPTAPGGGLPSGPSLHHFRISPNAEALKPGEDLLVIGHLGGVEPSALHLHVVTPPRDHGLG